MIIEFSKPYLVFVIKTIFFFSLSANVRERGEPQIKKKGVAKKKKKKENRENTRVSPLSIFEPLKSR